MLVTGQSKDNRPAMKKLLAACAVSTLAACTVSSPAPITPGPVSTAPVASTSDFTARLNTFRASQGRGTVRQSAILTRAAQAHADDMAARGYFSHESPGGPNGNNLVQRAAAAGCALRSGAENIASGQRSEAEVFAGWENSRGHRVNMLGRGYTEYGLGRAGNIWVLKFSSGC